MTIVDILILMLATWRLAFMLKNESGPYDMLITLRQYFGEKEWYELTHDEQTLWVDDNPMETIPDVVYTTKIGEIFECLGCLSVWTALAVMVLSGLPVLWIVNYALAFSAIAIFVEITRTNLVG